MSSNSPVSTIQSFSVMDFAYDFCTNLPEMLQEETIRTYLRILGIEYGFLQEPNNDNYSSEIKKMVRKFIDWPTIALEIDKFVKNRVSKIDFLSGLSDEQFAYVTNLSTDNTKLIACAGSGKTRSMLSRIKFMVEHGLANKNEVYAITFSESAAIDFRVKIQNMFPNHEEFCRLSNLSTIDSLAKSILCRVKSHKSENVEILSIAFRNYLQSINSPQEIHTFVSIKNIKHLFIDEAQDLNEVQFDITKLLQEKNKTRVHLIGDPNQNIYQFRRSSSSFLINFDAQQYDLTKNFRSTQEIINFSECFKHIPTKKSSSASGKKGNRVIIINKPSEIIHDIIVRFIRNFQKEKDLSEIAIICPTRGIGSYNTIGLSVFFNLLKTHNIPINQLYSETGMADEKHKRSGKIPGHINLLTYHGTKGLEFDIVFVMDFYQHLFNIKPTSDEHEIHKYLLYVACSRARDTMFVCAYTNTHGGFLNHWITNVSPIMYFSDTVLRVPVLNFRQKDEQVIQGITELISELSDYQLDQIHDFLTVGETDKTLTRRIFQDFTHIDRGNDETLFGIFVEELFYLQYSLCRNIPPRELLLIKMLLESKTIVIQSESDYKLLRQFISSNQLTWEQYDLTRDCIPHRIRELIDRLFNRDHELTSCVLCTNEFIQIVNFNLDDIKKSYERYQLPESYNYDYRKIIVDFFYLIVVQYAYDNNHFYYINNHGSEKYYLLKNGADLFNAMNDYATFNYLTCELNIKIPINYPKMSLYGEIDFIEKYNDPSSETIVDIKCTKEISFKYYIQLLLYNFCYYHQNPSRQLFVNKYKILNFLTGLEHHLIIQTTPEKLFQILLILADVGNLRMKDFNLVCDLETTGLIKVNGPYSYKPSVIPRSLTQKRGIYYYQMIYPEIIEIAIKDYDTGLVLINTMVKPKCLIEPEATRITGIRNEDLINYPTIDTVREVLQRQLKLFTNCRFFSHNGQSFDNRLLVFEKIIDPSKVTFIDTKSLIPIHMKDKLDSKKLSDIYLFLFNEKLKGHRAMADVDALIRIMREIQIRF